MIVSLRGKEIVRGKILHYLALIYPSQATLPLLQGELDIFGYPVPLDELRFHVAYLAEKGLAAVQEVRGPVVGKRIPLVKITTQGIDTYDGRLPADPGVYLEPRG